MEFIIEYIVTGESGRHTLVGRCGDRPVHVGAVFQSTYRYKTFGSARPAPRDRVDYRQVTVYVNEIQAYGKQLTELGQGMAGSLVVSGIGIESLAPGFILGDELPLPEQATTPGAHAQG